MLVIATKELVGANDSPKVAGLLRLSRREQGQQYMQIFKNYVLHHVGLIFPGLVDAEDFIALMGLDEDYRGRVEQWDCLCIFTKPASGAAIELVVPESGALKRFNKGAGGVHHYAYEVPDIELASRDCESRGMTMLLPAPIKGAGDFLCNFINPMSLRGIQIELVQPLELPRQDHPDIFPR